MWHRVRTDTGRTEKRRGEFRRGESYGGVRVREGESRRAVREGEG